MNEPRKKRTLIIIIAILLIANIATVSYLLMNRHTGKRDEGKGKLTEFLKDDVGYSAAQMASYDSLHNLHKQAMENKMLEVRKLKENRFNFLVSNNFNDSTINVAARNMNSVQHDLEVMMLQHLKQVRNIGTPQQIATFDSAFLKAMSKKRNAKKADKN